jgi:type II secretory pathway pseudopilin PulG
MGLQGVVEDLGDLVTDVGKDASEAAVDFADVFGDTPLIGLVNPGFGVLSQLDEVVELGGRLADWASDLGLDKLLLAATSPILAAGQAAIADMRETTGTAEPETGDRLSSGEQRLRDASDVLKGAHPDGDWAGAGSDAYSAADTRQEGRTTKLAGLDRQLHEVISREADQLLATRARLADQSNWLAEVGLTTFGYGLVPGIGTAMKEAAEIQAVMKALNVCSEELAALTSEVNANAAAVQQLVGQYASAAEGACPEGCAPGTATPYDDPRTRGPIEGGAPGRAPGGGTPGGGGNSGSGGGSGAGGARSSGTPSMPNVPSMPAAPPPASAANGAGGGTPGALGGLPSGLGGSPSGSGGGLASLVAEVIKAATQHAQDKKDAEEEDAEEEDTEDKDGDGKPDVEVGTEPAAASGAEPVAAVEPARPDQPMTVTLDRDRSIALPSTTTT